MTRHREAREAAEARDRIADLYQKAEGLYNIMVSMTDSPADGAEVICFMHMLLYLNNGVGGTTVDEMLRIYGENFKVNYEAQVEANKKVSN